MSAEPMNAPRNLQVNSRDNVAIVVNEGCLPKGTQFDSGLELIEDIPEAVPFPVCLVRASVPQRKG